MSKRKRFILSSLILSLGFIGIRLLPDQYKILSILGLSFLTLPLFYWSLQEGIFWDMTVMVLLQPFFFTLGVGFFWFLLPSSLFARIPIMVFYGFGIYALFLTSNIFTVAAMRTIALLRAARGVGFLLSLITMFLIFNALLSLRWWIYLTAPLIIFLSLPIYFQGFWTFNLDKSFSKDVFQLSLVSALVTGQLATALFFWPVSLVVGSLFLTATAYVLLGLGQAYLEERLFPQTIRDFLLVGIGLFVGMILSTHWG